MSPRPAGGRRELRLGRPGHQHRLDHLRFRRLGRESVTHLNEERRCCFDVLLPEGPDGRLRPNQLLAVGLPFPLLDTRRRELVLSAVEAALLTPVDCTTAATMKRDWVTIAIFLTLTLKTEPHRRVRPKERDRVSERVALSDFAEQLARDHQRDAEFT